MNKMLTDQLLDYLSPLGFELFKAKVPKKYNDGSIWLINKASEQGLADYCLRISYNKRFQTIAVEHGWNNTEARMFYMQALKMQWEHKYQLYKESGTLNWPCLIMHFLSNQLDIPFFGISLSSNKIINVDDMTKLLCYFDENHTQQHLNASELLSIYLNDAPATRWFMGPPSRIAMIASLLIQTNGDVAVFDSCAKKHEMRIRSQLRGSSSTAWFQYLREQIQANGDLN